MRPSESPSPEAMNHFLAEVSRGEEATLLLAENGLRYVPGGASLIVTFMPALLEGETPEPDEATSIWAEAFLRQRGHAILGVSRSVNNWYRAPDLHQALRALQAQGFFARHARVMFYGGSMGGFGALAFAALAPGCIVLAHNPQSTLIEALTPFETRYPQGRKCNWYGDFADGAIGARAASRVYVSYDPFHNADRRHVERLDPSNVIPLRVPMVGHQMPVWLQQMKLLGPVFDAALNGSLTSEGFAKLARARFQLPHYLLALAGRSRNVGLKEYLAEKARGIAPQADAPRRFLWDIERSRAAARAAIDVPGVLVWAMDGCDSDSCFDWLASMAPEVPRAKRPFQGYRRPHDLTVLGRSPSHHAMVRDEIRRRLESQPLLLHVVDSRTARFDQWLLAECARRNFVHLLVYTRDMASQVVRGRLVSTLAARPMDEVLDNLRDDIAALSIVEASLQRAGERIHRLATESLVGTSAEDLAARQRVAAALGVRLDPSPIVAPARQVRQTSSAINLLRDALAWMPGFEQGCALLEPSLQRSPHNAGVVLDPTPAILRAGSEFLLSGLAVHAHAAPSSHPTKLVVVQDGIPRDARWGQSSPGGERHFPGHAEARQARFGHVRVRADEHSPVVLAWAEEIGSRAKPAPVATLGFLPSGGRRHLGGIYLARWSLGYRPLPGTGSLAVMASLWLLDRDNDTLPKDLIGWASTHETDISGATFRFGVLEDPILRFQTLHRRWCAEAARTSKPRIGLDQFIQEFDRWIPSGPWRTAFAPQAALLGATHDYALLCRRNRLEPLKTAIEARTAMAFTLPAPPSVSWRTRLGWSPVSKSASKWINEHYASDVDLWSRI